MFPIRDDNPHLNFPVVTCVLIGLNVAAWLLLQGFGTEPALSQSGCRLGLIPGYGILLQLLGGFTSLGATGGGVAFWAHVGGFLAGALLVFPFKDRRLLDEHPYHGWHQKRQPTESWHRIRGGRGRWQ